MTPARRSALLGAAALLAVIEDIEPQHQLAALVIANRVWLDAHPIAAPSAPYTESEEA